MTADPWPLAGPPALDLKCLAVSGAQGVGKTTFCQDLQVRLAQDPIVTREVFVRGGVARGLKDSGIPSDGATRAEDYALYFRAHFENLLSAPEDRITVLDRTFADTIAYAILNGNLHQHWLDCFEYVAKQLLRRVDVYFWIPVENHLGLEDDGVRSTDRQYQLALDRVMRETLSSVRDDIVEVRGSREERVAQALVAIDARPRR